MAPGITCLRLVLMVIVVDVAFASCFHYSLHFTRFIISLWAITIRVTETGQRNRSHVHTVSNDWPGFPYCSVVFWRVFDPFYLTWYTTLHWLKDFLSIQWFLRVFDPLYLTSLHWLEDWISVGGLVWFPRWLVIPTRSHYVDWILNLKCFNAMENVVKCLECGRQHIRIA